MSNKAYDDAADLNKKEMSSDEEESSESFKDNPKNLEKEDIYKSNLNMNEINNDSKDENDSLQTDNQNLEKNSIDVPIMVTAHKYYDDIINFLLNRGSSLFRRDFMNNPGLLNKIVVSRKLMKSFNKPVCVLNNEAIFLIDTCSINDIEIYNENDKKEIINLLQKINLFKDNNQKDFNNIINSLFEDFKCFVIEILKKNPIICSKNESLKTLFMSQEDYKENYSQSKEAILYNASKKIFRNIIYHEKTKKKIKKLYKQFSFIEKELNCNFFVSNKEKILFSLFHQLSVINNNKILVKYDLIFEEKTAKESLEFINSEIFSKYFKYISSIIIITKNKEKTKNYLKNYEKQIGQIFTDNNEIIVFYKEKDPELFFPMIEIITLPKYKRKYYSFHTKLAKYYGEFSEENFKNAYNDVKEYLSYQEDDENFNNDLLEFLRNFNEFNKERYTKIIKAFLQNTSITKSLNSSLKELNYIFYEKINYFVADLMFCIKEYGKKNSKRLIGDHDLYREEEMTFNELLSYKQNNKSIIVFPFFMLTSEIKSRTSINTGKNAKQEINKRKKNLTFSVLMRISYSCDQERGQKCTCFDLSDFDLNDDFDKMFLPFSFFEIQKVVIDDKENYGIIYLKAINKEKILEKYINDNSAINYNEKKDIIEIKRVKNILIYDSDKETKLSELYKLYQFIEEEINGTLLIANSLESFKLIVKEINRQNMGKKNFNEVLITFELIIFGESDKELTQELNMPGVKEYFNSRAIVRGNKDEICKENFQIIISSKDQLLNHINSDECPGSILPIKITELINFSKYVNKYHRFHEIISKSYQNVNEKYSKLAMKIFEDFIRSSNNSNIQINNLLSSLKKFLNFSINSSQRYIDIIKEYTSDDNSFYVSFNSWLRDLDPVTYEKISFFVSSLMLSLNEYGKNSPNYIIENKKLYRGMKLLYPELLNYEQNIGNIIIFPAFTSTSDNEEEIEKFRKLKENEKSNGMFSVKLIIEYNCNEKQFPNAIFIDDISDYEESEYLILPFTFFIVSKTEIDIVNQEAIINLRIINREEIIENVLNKQLNLYYNSKNNIIIPIKNKIITYKIDDISRPTKIFGEDFVTNNFDNIDLIIEDEKHKLCKQYTFKNYGIQKIEIIEKYEITDFSYMFKNCTSLVSIDSFFNWNVEKINNMDSMFNNCSSLSSIRALKKWDVSNVTNMRLMFANCISLTSIKPLRKWKVLKVEEMSSMFYNCFNIDSIECLKKWNLNNLNLMKGMFANCISLSTIKLLNGWNLKKVENMDQLFFNCKKLRDISGLTNWDVSNVKSMRLMFYKCKYLNFIESLRNWKLTNLENMEYMFYQCENIMDISPLENWDVNKVKNMNNLFAKCMSLQSINALKNWKVDNVIDMRYMFLDCINIKNVDAIKEWKVSKLQKMDGICFNCASLRSISPIENWKTNKNCSKKSLYYNIKTAIENSNINENNRFPLSNIEFISHESKNLEKNFNSEINRCNCLNSDIFEININNKMVSYNIDNTKWATRIFGDDFVENNKKKIKLKIEGKIIYLCTKYQFKKKGENTIELIEFLPIKNMRFMFENTPLSSLDLLKNWDVSKVIDMSFMFSNCQSISSLEPLRDWDMGKVEGMECMFSNCFSIKSFAPLKKWKIKESVKKKNIFYGTNEDIANTIPENLE